MFIHIPSSHISCLWLLFFPYIKCIIGGCRFSSISNLLYVIIVFYHLKCIICGNRFSSSQIYYLWLSFFSHLKFIVCGYRFSLMSNLLFVVIVFPPSQISCLWLLIFSTETKRDQSFENQTNSSRDVKWKSHYPTPQHPSTYPR